MYQKYLFTALTKQCYINNLCTKTTKWINLNWNRLYRNNFNKWHDIDSRLGSSSMFLTYFVKQMSFSPLSVSLALSISLKYIFNFYDWFHCVMNKKKHKKRMKSCEKWNILYRSIRFILFILLLNEKQNLLKYVKD